MSIATGPKDSTVPRPSARTIAVRAGVGAAGRIIQSAQLTSHRVSVDAPTLIFVQNGRKRVCWFSGECTATAGEAIAIDAGQVVDISNTPDANGAYSARWISWNQESLLAFQATTPTMAPSSVAKLVSKLSPAFVAAYNAAFDSLSNFEIPISIANHRALEVLLWMHERGVGFESPSVESFSTRLRRLIASEPSYPWSIEDVSQRSQCSVATLRRRLSAEAVTFRDLLQDARMCCALALLQNTESPVLNVAFAVGYDSGSRFASRFRARFGYLPSAIRGQKRGTRSD